MMEWIACTQHKGLTSQLAQICAYRTQSLLIERQQVYEQNTYLAIQTALLLRKITLLLCICCLLSETLQNNPKEIILD